jgi:hypothetical protein
MKQTKWLIELSDNEQKIVTTEELIEMERTAYEFDGFYGWRVVKKITETENPIEQTVRENQ